jgi:CubicO group peptidase (beta-lactamase class C family)
MFKGNKGRMKKRYSLRKIVTLCVCLVILSGIIACAPRVTHFGLPQYEYQYAVPEKLDVGWEISSLSKEGVDPGKINALIRDILNKDLKNIHSVLLVKNGKLILEEYFYGYDRDTKHIMYSASKSITSILVGIAMDQKMIPNVDQKAYAFLPEYNGTKWVNQKYDITLKHVLTMSAGIDWVDWKYPHHDARNSTGAMARSGDWIKFVLDRDLLEPPGQRFNYSDGLTMLLGVIVKNTTGIYADEFAEKSLFSPLGISDYSWRKSPGGSVITAWGLSLKPRDMAKIGYLFLRQGKWNDRQIISQKWVNESTKPHMTDVALGSGYGYQWWCGKTNINNQVIEVYYAAGMGGQYIFVCPSLYLVAVITSSTIGNPLGELRPQAMMTDYILPAILPPAPTPKTIHLDPEFLERYAGKYNIDCFDAKLTIDRDSNKLLCKMFWEYVELTPVKENQFIGALEDIGDLIVNFYEDATGKVNHLIMDIGFSRLRFDKIK